MRKVRSTFNIRTEDWKLGVLYVRSDIISTCVERLPFMFVLHSRSLGRDVASHTVFERRGLSHFLCLFFDADSRS